MSESSEIGNCDRNDDGEVTRDSATLPESNSPKIQPGTPRLKSQAALFGQLLKIEVGSRSKWISDAVSVVPAKSWELL